MNNEIKEILEQLKELDNNYIILKEKGASFKATELEKKAHILYNHITNLQEEKDKFKLRCYKSLKLIRDNYGLLDKYGIDMIDDILNGGDDNE